MLRISVDTPCIQHEGYINPSGYAGQTSRNGIIKYQHVWAYIDTNGPVPEGFEVDHICNNRSCVNPEHLQVVTLQDNRRLAATRRTHCKNGHEWTEENTYYHGTRRDCRACRAAANRRRYGR